MTARGASAHLTGVLLGAFVCLGGSVATAQSLGTFTWQLQPFCNRLTVTVTQNGAIYTLDGYDDQCGAPQRAPLVGLATPNPDGSIGLGFHIATSPGGRTVSVEARISLATVGGPWTDSAGETGTLVLNGNAAGSARPAPPAGGVTLNSVTSTSIVDGSVGAVDIDASQVQRRLGGACATGSFMTGAGVDGVVTCRPDVTTAVVVGAGAMGVNTSGVRNVAIGRDALMMSVSTDYNTAVGYRALAAATTEQFNTAVGALALVNANGSRNVAIGPRSLEFQSAGDDNIAVGYGAMTQNLGSSSSVAIGTNALSTAGNQGNNVAIGYEALQNSTGGGNVGIGRGAGRLNTTGFNNIHIWHNGDPADNATIRIGAAGVQTRAFLAGVRGVTTATAAIPVLVGTDGQLGTVSSSRRFKFDIADMNDFSARLAALRPVTFRFTQPMADGSTPLDFGLIAEEVAEVFPELAVRGADGRIETVAYHKLPALLLNELQKQQRTISALQRELSEVRALVAGARR